MDPELAKDLGLKDGQSGALVSAVEPSGPAKAAGFEPGDVIVALNEKPVDNDQGLRNRIGLMRPGSKTKMKVIRNGKTIELTATLTNWPNQTDAVEIEENLGDQPFGLVVKNITSKYRKKFKIKAKEGVVITDITPNSSAERAGLQPGDVITKINNIYIRRIKNFKRAIKGKNRIQLRVWRDRRELFFPLRK
jgi:serine protease Do